MEHIVTPVQGGKIQITITLSPEEKAKFELRALRQAGSDLNIKGFRPGHVPDHVLRQQIGEDDLQQEAMWQAVKEFYPKLVTSLDLAVIGQPNLALQSWDPMVILVTVAKLPEVDLGKWQEVRVKRQQIKITNEEIDKLVEQIRDSRASEAAVARAAKLGDRVEMDFEVSLGGVIMDGGKQISYPAILGAGQLVPGFEENIVGLRADEEKMFEITFPKDYRSDLAGKTAQVWVKLKQVFERNLPELTDEFARGLGRFEGADDFKKKLAQNLYDEKAMAEEQRLERAMFEALVEKAAFAEIPQVMLDNEKQVMLHELKSGIAEQGLEWGQYLQSIQQDEKSLRAEFSKPAERRVKVALLVRAFARQEKLEADAAAVEQEIAHALERHGSDERVVAQLNSESYRDYVKQVLTNRRVIEWLKQKLVE